MIGTPILQFSQFENCVNGIFGTEGDGGAIVSQQKIRI